jgi:hypothetical protein
MNTEHNLALARKAAYAASDALEALSPTGDTRADIKALVRACVLANNTFKAWTVALALHEKEATQ